MSVARFLRCALVTALVASASGATNVVLVAMDADECATGCDGDSGPRHCPPNCEQGSCAKVTPSLAASPGLAVMTPLADLVAGEAPVSVHAPDLPMLTSGVFHPPRA